MSIKSDNWIRRMAREQRLIEPFEPLQVRAGEGGRVISYGTSSYGYDVRCASEFKIFTNINSTIVDPKRFDEKSFVDIKADVCIIPPNSFALARTVEYFRIPRQVLTVCVGKSTYARCFRGDSRIALVDGRSARLEDMARAHERGELFRGYSIDASGRLMVTLLDQPRFIARDAVLEIVLDNGELIHATADHDFLRRDGSFDRAAQLRPGDSLMPLHRQWRGGQEHVYQPLNGQLLATARLADECNLRHGIYPARAGEPRQQLNPARRSNGPPHLTRLGGSDARGPSHRPAAPRRHEIGASGAAAHYPGGDRALVRSFAKPGQRCGELRPRNHSIVAIRELPGEHDVYCLSVPEAGNFALEAGVFVRNCGIIVNVTPLEPEWEGHVTLEFSNTTPLPAKIYANEGVAQMLFFESDEVCSTSYADRGGKYQGQQGVTLPKA